MNIEANRLNPSKTKAHDVIASGGVIGSAIAYCLTRDSGGGDGHRARSERR